MPTDQLSMFHIVGALVLTLYVTGVVVWLRIRYLKEQYKSVQKEAIAQTKAATRLKKVCDQHRFEVEWLQATVQGTNSGTHFLEILKRWSPDPKNFYGWVIYDNNDWDGTNRDCYPEKVMQRFSYQATDYKVSRTQYADDFSELPAAISTLTFFRTHQPGAESCVIVISQIPNCFSSQTDFRTLTGFMKFAKCQSRYVPQKLIEFEDDLENAIVKEMLEIRSLLDDEFQSPVELMKGFLQKLTTLSGYTYASLYLSSEVPESRFSYNHYASGGALRDGGNDQDWRDAEKLFIDSMTGRLDEMLILNTETIMEYEAKIPFRCGIILPVRQDGQFVGVLMLTHTDETLPSNEDAQLVEWASQFLMKTLNREITRIETIDQARRDPLTNVANRRTFDMELNRVLERTRNGSEICSLIMLDIDHFKSINDQHGHLKGDEVLCTVAEAVQNLTQNQKGIPHALTARYGGEEFAVILSGVDLNRAMQFADAIRQMIEELDIEKHLKITASFGVACSDRHGNSYEELVHYADEALYAAKKSGRNQVCVTKLKKLNHNVHNVIES